jgi:hypothetical protein
MSNIRNIFGFGPWWPSKESDRIEICSVKSPGQEVCIKFQFHSCHQRMNCTHNTSNMPVPGFEPNLCLNEKGGKFEFEVA